MAEGIPGIIIFSFLFLVVNIFCLTAASTEGEDLLRIINTSLRSESLRIQDPSSTLTPTTVNPILADSNSQEYPDVSQYDALLPTKKPKFVSLFANNITLRQHTNLTYYANLLKETIPPQHRLEYLDAISDRLKFENKFQLDEFLEEFADLFYWTLRNKSPGVTPWSKKIEKKTLKRFLKFALASETLTSKPQPTEFNQNNCKDLRPLIFLSKKFYQSMFVLSEEEGYEILVEVLANRNVTIPTDQLQDIQCLYYRSFQGMQNGRAYIYSEFDDDWDRRNEIFGKPIILQSIREMVAEETATPKQTSISDFMQRILTILPEYRSKIEEEKRSGPKKTPKKFHQVVQNLEGKLMGVQKSDIFVDADSKDMLMSTGVEALLDVTSDVFDAERFPVVFEPFNRHDWNQLQKLRFAGIQIFDKYNNFFSRLVKSKITEVYNSGRGLSRTFSNAFHHIRLLPTGPLILEGFETLNSLMGQTPPRDKDSHANRIKNFEETLQFLRGLYSTDGNVLNSLPQQVQILTDPNLNKNLKLMLKFAPSTGALNSEFLSSTEDDMLFAEVGVNNGELEIQPFPYMPLENSSFVNAWQFHLGYFKGYSEAWGEPVIKAEILLVNQTSSGLGYKWRESSMVFENKYDGDDAAAVADGGFWDLNLSPDGQSFKFMYQGKLEMFFKVVLDSEGKLPIGIKGEHHVPHHLPEGFKPAEFFVVPAGEYF